MSLSFQRRIEDFTCGQCGTFVSGSGYTNHCPTCMWSKHVDMHPGDRACPCQGMMRPIGVMMVAAEPVLVHECVVCRFRKKNKVTTEDSPELIAVLAAKVIHEK